MRLSWSSVVYERSKKRILTCNVVRRRACERGISNISDKVIVLRVERAVYIRAVAGRDCIVRDDRVLEIDRAVAGNAAA